jgi:transcriptional regulator with XRE-family HTH domain
MGSPNLLGEFLRAQRARLAPGDVGLPGRGGRRVPGLRREELASLADVSADYYRRIEQGHQLPSDEVAEALARALRLDDIAAAYLRGLARSQPRSQPGSRQCRRSRGTAGRELQMLLDQWATTPAWVSDRCACCIAANALATELNPSFAPGLNTLSPMFLQEADKREIFVNYDECVEDAVASLRARAGGHLRDPEFAAYIRDLEAASPRFAELWARQEVRFHSAGYKRLRHPVAGQMDFRSESMTVNDTEGYTMTLYYAEPGSGTAARLALLQQALQARPARRDAQSQVAPG